MRKKRHKPEELRQVNVLASQGKSVADAICAIGVTEVTYYRWRQEYGGLKSDQVKRLKDLEAENTRLRRAVSDLTLEDDPGLGCAGKLLSPARRRACMTPIDCSIVGDRLTLWEAAKSTTYSSATPAATRPVRRN